MFPFGAVTVSVMSPLLSVVPLTSIVVEPSIPPAVMVNPPTGDVTDDSYVINNITATNKIIPGLRFNHDGVTVEEGTTVQHVTPVYSADGYRVTSLNLGIHSETTESFTSYSRPEGTDTDGTSTYSAGFGDLVEITAEADTGTVDLEVFVANT